MNDIAFTRDAFEQFLSWQKRNKKIAQKIVALIKDIGRNGVMNGIDKPEKLKYRECFSRRIDESNRLVYDINESGDIKILSCLGHYED